MASGKKDHQRIKIDGMRTYIFYTKVRGVNWTNAIIVPVRGLQIPTYLSGLLLLAVICIALSVAYWVSRITIRRSTQPLQLLARSADEVAKGNFQRLPPPNRRPSRANSASPVTFSSPSSPNHLPQTSHLSPLKSTFMPV